MAMTTTVDPVVALRATGAASSAPAEADDTCRGPMTVALGIFAST
jgi:hypothetical protein